MQNLHEKMVKRRWGAPEFIKVALVVFGFLIVVGCTWLVSGWLASNGLSMLFPIIIVAAGYGGYYLISSMRIEYEYSYFQGDMDLDMIVAKRKRIRIASVNIRDFEEFGDFGSLNKTKQQMKGDYERRIFMCSYPQNPDCKYVVFRYECKKTLLVFEPDEDTINAMKGMNPRLFRQWEEANR